MEATLTYFPGKFVWRELFTKDIPGAKRFYTELFGWRTEDAPMGPDWSYTLIYVGDKQIGGMMDIANVPNGEHIPPHWSVYASVPDVDAAAEKAKANGGQVASPCMDIPNVGRFAVIQDPQGGHMNVFKSMHGDPQEGMPGAHEFCWEQLNAPDPQALIPFYQAVVGWGTEPMGEMTLFNRKSGAASMQVASVFPAPPGVPAHWLTYVAIHDLAATVAKCQELGGDVAVERIDVPGVGAFAVLKDPFGAFVCAFQGDVG
ncbi:MAG: Glyoxalase/bleomycin resistance protein/dioxygenase [Cyanobacteria bacterium RYN_339]|nr:Glyoxalase/bleomycin resistance protein/dioxygenase [Cyanobacteria bacterium RYN_339]